MTLARLYNFVNDRNNAVPITASRVDAELDQIIANANANFVISASAPSTPVDGAVWVDTTNNYVKWYNVSTWVIIGSVLDDCAVGGTLSVTESIKLTETTAPTTAASVGAVYTKDTGGQPELFYREESSGDEVQITSGGSLNVTLTKYLSNPTDSQYIAAGTTGTISVDADNSISFGVTFDSAPRVILTPTVNATDPNLSHEGFVKSVSTTGFVLRSNAAGASAFYWLAIGTKA